MESRALEITVEIAMNDSVDSLPPVNRLAVSLKTGLH